MSFQEKIRKRVHSDKVALEEAKNIGHLVDDFNLNIRTLRSGNINSNQSTPIVQPFSPLYLTLAKNFDNFKRDESLKGRSISFEDIPSNFARRDNMTEFSIADFNRMIPEFKGDVESLPIFLKRCDTFCAALNDNGKARFLSHLIFKLGGKAFTIFESKVFVDWATLKAALQEGIKVSKSTSALQSELMHFRQSSTQSCKEFADELKEKLRELNEILNLQYESEEVLSSFRQEHEKIAIRSFREGLLPPLKYRIMNVETKSLDDLVKKAVEEEPFVRVSKPSTLSSSTQSNINEIRNSVARRLFSDDNQNQNSRNRTDMVWKRRDRWNRFQNNTRTPYSRYTNENNHFFDRNDRSQCIG